MNTVDICTRQRRCSNVLMHFMLTCVKNVKAIVLGDTSKFSIRWQMSELLMLLAPAYIALLRELLRDSIERTTGSVSDVSQTDW